MTATEVSPFESLQQQIMEKRDAVQKQQAAEVHVRQASDDSQEMGGGSEGEGGASDKTENKGKGFTFKKGEASWHVDDDAEFQFVADKRQMKMTLKELRDAAAGGVAVRNRMRQLAEEKKSLQDPYKEFSKIYKEDPYNALKKVFSAIQKIDPQANFDEFLTGLGKQAQTVAQMEPSARKSYLLEKELKEVQQEKTESQQLLKLGELKAELAQETGLSDERIFQFGEQILKHPVLSQTVKNEEDLIERIGDLAEEVEMQKASHEALQKYKTNISPRDPLVFELSNILKQNPDFDERDLQDIAKGVLGTVQKSQASQTLSRKQRNWSGTRNSDPNLPPDYSKMKPVDALRLQIEAKRKSQQQQKHR